MANLDDMQIVGASIKVHEPLLGPFKHLLFPYFEKSEYSPRAEKVQYLDATTAWGDVVVIPEFANPHLVADVANMENSEWFRDDDRFRAPTIKLGKLDLQDLRSAKAHVGIVCWVERQYIPYGVANRYYTVNYAEDAAKFLIQHFGRSPDAAAVFLQEYLNGVINSDENPALGRFLLEFLHLKQSRGTWEPWRDLSSSRYCLSTNQHTFMSFPSDGMLDSANTLFSQVTSSCVLQRKNLARPLPEPKPVIEPEVQAPLSDTAPSNETQPKGDEPDNKEN